MEHIPVNDTAKAPAARFTGDVYLTMIKTPEPPSRLVAALVRFTPGARTNWHSHAGGQTLHVTEGVGYVVNRDGQVIRMRAGDTVWTPPGEEHWHGGTNTTRMSHIAMLEGTETDDAPPGSNPSPTRNTRPPTRAEIHRSRKDTVTESPFGQTEVDPGAHRG